MSTSFSTNSLSSFFNNLEGNTGQNDAIHESHLITNITQSTPDGSAKVVTAPATFFGKTVAFLFGSKTNLAKAIRNDLVEKYGEHIANSVFNHEDVKHVERHGLNVLEGKQIYAAAEQKKTQKAEQAMEQYCAATAPRWEALAQGDKKTWSVLADKEPSINPIKYGNERIIEAAKAKLRLADFNAIAVIKGEQVELPKQSYDAKEMLAKKEAKIASYFQEANDLYATATAKNNDYYSSASYAEKQKQIKNLPQEKKAWATVSDTNAFSVARAKQKAEEAESNAIERYAVETELRALVDAGANLPGTEAAWVSRIKAAEKAVELALDEKLMCSSSELAKKSRIAERMTAILNIDRDAFQKYKQELKRLEDLKTFLASDAGKEWKAAQKLSMLEQKAPQQVAPTTFLTAEHKGDKPKTTTDAVTNIQSMFTEKEAELNKYFEETRDEATPAILEQRNDLKATFQERKISAEVFVNTSVNLDIKRQQRFYDLYAMEIKNKALYDAQRTTPETEAAWNRRNQQAEEIEKNVQFIFQRITLPSHPWKTTGTASAIAKADQRAFEIYKNEVQRLKAATMRNE